MFDLVPIGLLEIVLTPSFCVAHTPKGRLFTFLIAIDSVKRPYIQQTENGQLKQEEDTALDNQVYSTTTTTTTTTVMETFTVSDVQDDSGKFSSAKFFSMFAYKNKENKRKRGRKYMIREGGAQKRNTDVHRTPLLPNGFSPKVEKDGSSPSSQQQQVLDRLPNK